MNVEIRRGTDRFLEREPGRLSRHGFSFGPHLDPDRLSFGPMVCHDDHVLGRGTGFEEHPHEGLEIITWVVSGAVVHRDATGAEETLAAGDCAVLSAGAGVRHAEVAGPDGPARFVQVWLRPDDPDAPPGYARASVAAGPGAGLVRLVGPGGPLTVGVAGASLDVVRLGAGETVALPAAPRVHAFLTTGALLRSSLAEPLSAGDALCVSDGPSYEVTAGVPTEILVWSFG
ncbi:pirin family protein [Nocardioides daeguensis]|uniref:Pirin family protein n=1 Tax=Nocardioides daeguensis TaxID=908359 RepID=A0ABP6WHQ7_9ACTN|nr:pirin family protein [Nocardioides daeguensis]MBV6727930.1 pirin family protein [Nocardioides daeguensis]MCR1771673.1 pirin family protein [Nocardioides daeguensis]